MFTVNCKGKMLCFDDPVVMGILNTTPDSFYVGSRVKSVDDILFTADKMINDGATILDIGGQSTRPKSKQIPEEEEMTRVLPAVEAVARKFPEQIISIDTFYSGVAKAAVEAGAHIVNDVSAATIDDKLISTVSTLGVPYVVMHMLGSPQSMQENPTYKNVTLEVFDFLNRKIEVLTRAGINDIIIDVGFGFGKTAAHNFQLLRELSFFRQLGKPILVGLSRKGTIYRTLGVTADEALNGTTVMNTLALENGAGILRVHDVKEAAETIKLFLAYKNEKEQL
jgi:dihydropteroate synthase